MSKTPWLVLAGVGAAAMLWTARRESIHHRQQKEARERARLVPQGEARQEADWTRQAISYAGGAKGG